MDSYFLTKKATAKSKPIKQNAIKHFLALKSSFLTLMGNNKKEDLHGEDFSVANGKTDSGTSAFSVCI